MVPGRLAGDTSGCEEEEGCVNLPKPYYQEDGITIYHSDCHEVLPHLEPDSIDLVLTDPPYTDYHTDLYTQTSLKVLNVFMCRQLVFWSAKAEFTLDYTAIHIWDKKTGVGSEYERIFERHGSRNYKMFRHYLINSTVAASYTGDAFTGHPSQKPLKLLTQLLDKFSQPDSRVLDPFMGSGGTLLAAKNLNRKCVGVEVSERYCEIAAKRLAQGVLPLEMA
jgi:site-specific DNA-methyltransferase (adenine-specific)